MSEVEKTFIRIDNINYEIDLKTKEVKGPDKKYNEKEFKDKLEKVPFFVLGPDAESDKTLHAFTNEAKLEKWLEKKNLIEDYKKNKEFNKRAMKKLSKGDEEEIKKHQIKMVEDSTEVFRKMLKENNIEQNEVEKIKKLFEEQDPNYGPILRCLVIYEHTWYRGSYKFLYSRTSYPNFGWYGFNDKISSILCIFHNATFYEHTKYGGRQLWLFTSRPNLTWWPYWFNDIISSAIVHF